MKFSKEKLKNGLRMVTVPMKDTQTVTLMILVKIGSDYESKEQNGISHFIEHMCFKGTEKRPTSAHIATELDSLGADYNAFTGGLYTGYYIKGHNKHTETFFDIVSDIYLNSNFPESEIEKEKGVVIEEINMYEDNPKAKVGRVMDELVYGDQPVGRDIAGTKETVNSFKRDDLVKYHKKYYVPNNTVVIVSGKINEKKIKKIIKDKFSKIKKAKKSVKPKIIENQTKPKIRIEHKDSDQTHLIISFRGIDMYDKNTRAARALSTALGNGMSSRLFKKMREELGICYYIHTGNLTSLDHGAFYIKAGVSNSRVLEAVSGILEEVEKIRNEKIGEVELSKVKEYILGGIFLGLETSDSFADYYGFQEFFDKKVITPEESGKLIEKVKAEDILKMAKFIFQSKNMNLAIVGPHKDNEEKIKEIFVLK